MIRAPASLPLPALPQPLAERREGKTLQSPHVTSHEKRTEFQHRIQKLQNSRYSPSKNKILQSSRTAPPAHLGQLAHQHVARGRLSKLSVGFRSVELKKMADTRKRCDVAGDTLDAHLHTRDMETRVCCLEAKARENVAADLAVHAAGGRNHGVGGAVVQRAPDDDARQVPAQNERKKQKQNRSKTEARNTCEVSTC